MAANHPVQPDGGDCRPAIRARGLTRRFGDLVAVDHVDLTVQRGEIVGANGAERSAKVGDGRAYPICDICLFSGQSSQFFEVMYRLPIKSAIFSFLPLVTSTW